LTKKSLASGRRCVPVMTLIPLARALRSPMRSPPLRFHLAFRGGDCDHGRRPRGDSCVATSFWLGRVDVVRSAELVP